jgi:hypothetical protein
MKNSSPRERNSVNRQHQLFPLAANIGAVLPDATSVVLCSQDHYSHRAIGVLWRSSLCLRAFISWYVATLSDQRERRLLLGNRRFRCKLPSAGTAWSSSKVNLSGRDSRETCQSLPRDASEVRPRTSLSRFDFEQSLMSNGACDIEVCYGGAKRNFIVS